MKVTQASNPRGHLLRDESWVLIVDPMASLGNHDGLQGLLTDTSPQRLHDAISAHTVLAAHYQQSLWNPRALLEAVKLFHVRPDGRAQELRRGFDAPRPHPFLDVFLEEPVRHGVRPAVRCVPVVPGQELQFSPADEEYGGLGDGKEAEVPMAEDSLVRAGLLVDLVSEAWEGVLGDDEAPHKVCVVARKESRRGAPLVEREYVKGFQVEEFDHGGESIRGVLGCEWSAFVDDGLAEAR